ncbi:MAG: hypothetical protein RL757_175 [Bacteroidota bacterium]|jgi:multidrug efflux pump subunit AcrB
MNLDKIKEFRPASWSIDNRTTIYALTLILLLAGYWKYNNLPKEQFPEIIFPQIMVNTIYPGTSPTNMESLVAKEIEKEVKSIVGVKKVTSNSVQNFSSVMVEFGTDQDVEKAKQRVKDAVDRAKLPSDLQQGQPTVIDIDISQTPIMNVHLSGDIDLEKLKKYADDVKTKIEGMKEIRRVDIVGALDKEIQVNVDLYKMESNNITLGDIERGIQFENMTISGGEVDMGNLRRAINVAGQFKDPNIIKNLIIRGATGAQARLSDIADVRDTYAEKASYARLEGKNVISLNVIKKGGQNLIESSDKIRALMKDLQATEFPKSMKVTITGDQSDTTRVTLHDLINTIIIGFLLVTLILMFFMGTTNAIFVAMSVPLSMCVAFLVEPAFFTAFLGQNFSLNMIVLFSFLLALGIVVDDAIVVIENTHRIFDNGKVPIIKAAKLAAGEVFIPVLSGTLTTLAPFFPLAFWQGIIGKFMFFLPITMIITLFASLVVAYIINPVFAADFMKPHTPQYNQTWRSKMTKGLLRTVIIFAVLMVFFYAKKNFLMGNLTTFILFWFLLDKFFLQSVFESFQNKVWPRVQNAYAGIMKSLLKGKRPILVLLATLVLFVFSFILVGIRQPNVVFFPMADPNFAFTYIKMPVGTDVNYTNDVTKEVEKRIMEVVGANNPLVSSIISNVAVGANDPQSFDFSVSPNAAKVTVAFVKFSERNGQSTLPYLTKIREALKGIPGAQIVVEQEKGGPPTGKPISIEITGDDFTELSKTSSELKKFLDAKQIAGVEELKSDLISNKPEITVQVDRERASREGISTAQIGMALRTSLFGKEVSKYKDIDADRPIQLRLAGEQRNNLEDLMNQKVIFRDMNMGGILRSIPLSTIASIKYENTYGGIRHKNQKRIVKMESNVLTGFNPNNVVAQVQSALTGFKAPESITVKFGGEQEEQKESMGFLGGAGLASIGLIFFILVLQFNSLSKPLIIMSEILFSVTGVLLGFSIFKMDISIIMTGIGLVALMGIVVRNGILLVEFTDTLLSQGYELRKAIIEAGRTRMTPVLLTAAATTLGLIPLAVGLNMDFAKLLETGNPHLFFGGDSVAFWGPLAWTMIFGLVFATFLTLVLVPAMLLMSESLKIWLGDLRGMPYNPTEVAMRKAAEAEGITAETTSEIEKTHGENHAAH